VPIEYSVSDQGAIMGKLGHSTMNCPRFAPVAQPLPGLALIPANAAC
jgi:hypothetical protein